MAMRMIKIVRFQQGQAATFVDLPFLLMLGSKFSALPPPDVLRSVIQTYFHRCHHQPYCYFDEKCFWDRLEKKQIPTYLLLAVLATATRFSHDSYFGNEQLAACEHYSRSAWTEIFEKSFSSSAIPGLSIVQATNMLAVVDFTAGQHKPAWVKIGLAIRFAQSLQLGCGRRGSEVLDAVEKYERSVSFWSVYLLDRLVSCGSNRPPTINDNDCSLPLPTGPTDVELSSTTTIAKLQELYNSPNATQTFRLSPFASSIFMASVLGRVERCFLQHHYTSDPYPPWDARSEYMSIYSLLLDFEVYSDASRIELPELISHMMATVGGISPARTGHVVFSVVLWHMNHCLMAHPFFAKKLLSAKAQRAPLTFLRDVRRRALQHAEALTKALGSIRDADLSIPSFYGYACAVACTIHRLYMNHRDSVVATFASRSFEASIDFLRWGANIWTHYSRAAAALTSFQPSLELSNALIGSEIPFSANDESSDSGEDDSTWNLLDYGWLSDMERSSSEPSPADGLESRMNQKERPNLDWWTGEMNFGTTSRTSDDMLVESGPNSAAEFDLWSDLLGADAVVFHGDASLTGETSQAL